LIVAVPVLVTFTEAVKPVFQLLTAYFTEHRYRVN